MPSFVNVPSFFCTFIQEIAFILNDPGFDFGTGYDADATMVNRRGAKSQVFVHKTSIMYCIHPRNAQLCE
jgi:hypothetical protein